MRLTTEDIRRIIKEELESFLMEKESILPKPPQNWQILLYSAEEAQEQADIKAIINRIDPQPYEEEEDKCRRFESTADPNPRHVMITPAIKEEIKSLANSSPKPFKKIAKDKFIEYLNKIQKTAFKTAKLVWKRIEQYPEDPTRHIYARYSCKDDFGKMMTYLEADKDFLREK